jgi:hypothetical protein
VNGIGTLVYLLLVVRAIVSADRAWWRIAAIVLVVGSIAIHRWLITPLQAVGFFGPPIFLVVWAVWSRDGAVLRSVSMLLGAICLLPFLLIAVPMSLAAM